MSCGVYVGGGVWRPWGACGGHGGHGVHVNCMWWPWVSCGLYVGGVEAMGESRGACGLHVDCGMAICWPWVSCGIWGK